MNTTVVALIALALYLIFYFVYGKQLQTKLVRSHEAPDAPSKRLNDGIDFVPTSKYVLFGHHFASIAGAGPITGPAMAIVWGWLPGLLWVWFGNIFVGAIHDYLSLVASVRYDGRSVQYVAQDVVGSKAGKSFGWFILFLCVLVVAAFGDIVAGQFAAGNGEVASTFFLFCLAAIILGGLMYHTKLGVGLSTLVGIAMLIGAFALGAKFGIKTGKTVWFLVIFVYIVLASTMPVNILLQPRDYLNSFLLYFGILIGGVAAIISFRGFTLPAATTFAAKGAIGSVAAPFWPAIPLVIACGALSGFHSLVASGTSSKQLRDEKDALFIGYGAMLTEGFLATIGVIAMAAFGSVAFGSQEGLLKAGAIPRFTNSFGVMVNAAIPFISVKFMTLFAAIWVSSFAMTSLDTTNRLGRYIVAELALPLKDKNPGAFKFLSDKWAASIIVGFLGIGLAYTGNYTVLWPAFSGANQLIASIVMLTVALWVKQKLNEKYVNLILVPAILLWITVTAGVIWYTAVVIPGMFANPDNVRSIITGVVVGFINIVMLILNFISMAGFIRNFNVRRAAPARA
ncbi:MAG: carbon starvation protein A [Spirochaetaceae bacterium]|jgi:carbon starvation protein|nr:carbon starvation protein A [Spirochaetaceae bacterium]